MTVLKPPQKKTPDTKPTASKPTSEYLALGFFSAAQRPAIFPAINILQTRLKYLAKQGRKGRNPSAAVSTHDH
ncbi:hypothetical protein, partial [Rhodoferax sp.]|uniref:hypothetical protein n=1 Tax=Rhodoferax sp. TaxID=50421 RepID=UPI0027434CA7|nr:hypothetical protein [Rhodoferax sp.]